MWEGRNSPEASLSRFRRIQEVRKEGSAMSSSVGSWTLKESGCGSRGMAVTIKEAGGCPAVRKGGRPVVGVKAPRSMESDG